MNLAKIETYRNPFEKGKGRDIETSSCGSVWLGHGWALASMFKEFHLTSSISKSRLQC